MKTIFLTIACSLCLFSLQAQKVVSLKPAEFLQRMEEQKSAVLLIDVRPATDFETEHIPNAINIEATNTFLIQEMKKRMATDNTPVFVYCKLGKTSKIVSKQLLKSGINTVYSLKGGFFAWEKFRSNER